MKAMQFDFVHTDHGISDDQWGFIRGYLEEMDPDALFVQQVTIPPNLGTVECGLHGPAMGDVAVSRDEITMLKRGDADDQFRWPDPIVERPTRSVDYVQIIGIRAEEDLILVFTVYGGPLAPQNPLDPNNPDVPGSEKFWGEHALSA